MSEQTVTGTNAALFLGSLMRASDADAGVNAHRLAADARAHRPAAATRLRIASTRSAWRPSILPAIRTVGRCEHRPGAARPRARRCRMRARRSKPRLPGDSR